MASWVRGVANVVSDCKVRELRVDPDKTYVYSVRAWEKASGPFGDLKTNMEEYWKTGITLTEWIGRFSKDETMKSVEWELLLNVNDLESVKPVAAKRVAGNAYRSNTEEGTLDSYLMRLLK